MKKIIDGKLYNTETATKLGEWDNGLMCNDFNYNGGELYRTKNGAYFVHHDFYGGENIVLISESEARLWMEEHEDADHYIAAFGEPKEG